MAIRQFHTKHPRFFVALVIVVLIVIIVLILELTDTTHFFHKTVSTIKSTRPTSTTAQSVKKKQSGSSSSSSATAAAPAKSTAPATPATNGGAPATPTGNFVSNHHPNLSGKPAPSQEASVCVTSPGATCYIEFTQGNVVKKLAAQTTDSNGAAYWTWDVNQDGFGTGSWQIAAVATANGQSATGKDSQALVVQP